MRKAIYLGIIATGIILAAVLMTLYYTQQFSAVFSFRDSIPFNEIQIVQGQDYNHQLVLNSASVIIGSLALSNKGYFTQIYNKPKVIGCLNFKSEVDLSKIYNKGFSILLPGENNYDYYDSNSQNKIEVPLGEETYTLTATYNGNNAPISAFTSDAIESISIFVIDEKVNNPLSDSGYSYYSSYDYTRQCDVLKQKMSPTKTILIN